MIVKWLVGLVAAGLTGVGAAVLVVSAGHQSDVYSGVRVIDGDTVRLSSGERVRLIGIDTPEKEQCGYRAAKRHLRELVEGQQVVLRTPEGVDDQDKYGRLLRFVDVVDGPDTGREQLRAGFARARYDSRDGYDRHPREAAYHRLDRRAERRCEDQARSLAGRAERLAGDLDGKKLSQRPDLPRLPRPRASPGPDAGAAPSQPPPPPELLVPPAGWTTDALTPGYNGCRQGYPGGPIEGVNVWRPINC